MVILRNFSYWKELIVCHKLQFLRLIITLDPLTFNISNFKYWAKQKSKFDFYVDLLFINLQLVAIDKNI